jgi:HNH endonuclease
VSVGGVCLNGCTRKVKARGRCASCYQGWRLEQLALAGIRCTHCDEPAVNLKRLLCAVHYGRFLVTGDPMGTGRPDMGKEREERFWEKVDKGDPRECWAWTAGLSAGYGQFIEMRDGRGHPSAAHRVAWELLIGPIPDGLDLDHLCHTRDTSCPGGDDCPHRRCVNPAHLEPVSNEENIRRGMCPSAVNSRKTHCTPGNHEFTPENTYHPPKQPHTRQCRQCSRERQQRRNAA